MPTTFAVKTVNPFLRSSGWLCWDGSLEYDADSASIARFPSFAEAREYLEGMRLHHAYYLGERASVSYL